MINPSFELALQQISIKKQLKKINKLLDKVDPANFRLIAMFGAKVRTLADELARLKTPIDAQNGDEDLGYIKVKTSPPSDSSANGPKSLNFTCDVPPKMWLLSDPVSDFMNILLKTDIPPFDGNLLNWCSFRDTFRDLVDANTRLSGREKFHLLRSCLHKEAANVTKYLSTSDESYRLAWNTLQKRYNVPRLIAQSHVKALFDLPHMTKNDPKQLAYLLRKMEIHRNGLRFLTNEQCGHVIFNYIICSKLDPETRLAWEQSLTDNELPTTKQLLAFVGRCANALEWTQLTA